MSVRGHPGLQSEFQDSQGYREILSQKTKQNKTKQNKTKYCLAMYNQMVVFPGKTRDIHFGTDIHNSAYLLVMDICRGLCLLQIQVSSMLCVLLRFFYSCTKVITKKQLGEESVYSVYTSNLLFII